MMTVSLVLAATCMGAYPWSMLLERIDKPTETMWVTNEVESISVRTGFSTAPDGSRVALATVTNGASAWRIRRFCARPFSRQIPEDFEALYYPSGLGLRYARLPAADAGKESHGWVRLARPDGEHRFGPKGKGLASPGVYPNWTTTMAWFTCAWAGGGVYWGCHDPAYATKWPLPLYDAEGREMTFEAIYGLNLAPGERWTMPLTVERDYRGTWHEAAKVYRDWFLSTMRPRSDVSKGMTGQVLCILKQQNGEIVWPYTEIDALVDVAKAHGLDWIGLFGWTAGGHDHLYPDYDPDSAMGGRDALVRGIRRIHERGFRCYLYANGQLQEREATDYWRTTGRFNAIVKDTGKTYRQTWRKFADAPAHTFDLGCLRSEAWFRRMLSLARQANDLGADGILYDQLGNSPPRACYAGSHGHPVGQFVFAEDKELFIRRLKAEMAKENPEFIFATEGLGDVFADTFSFYHGMSAGAHPHLCMDNVLKRFAGGVNDAADFWPELFRYTFPEIVSTCRMPSPFLTRACVNYDAIFGLKHEIEIRYRPDRRYVESGVHPGENAYGKVLAPPSMDMMKELDQRTEQAYLKSVCDFQRRWAKYLLEGAFRDTENVCVSGPAAKRFEAADGTSVTLVWNFLEASITPTFAADAKVDMADSPEGSVGDPRSPMPANSLRLYVFER